MHSIVTYLLIFFSLEIPSPCLKERGGGGGGMMVERVEPSIVNMLCLMHHHDRVYVSWLPEPFILIDWKRSHRKEVWKGSVNIQNERKTTESLRTCMDLPTRIEQILDHGALQFIPRKYFHNNIVRKRVGFLFQRHKGHISVYDRMLWTISAHRYCDSQTMVAGKFIPMHLNSVLFHI